MHMEANNHSGAILLQEVIMADLKFITQYLNFFTRSNTLAELEQKPDFLATLMQTVETLIMVLDEQGRIIEFNPACEKLSGYTRAEVLGKKVTFLIPPDEQAGVDEVLQQLIAGQQPLHYENHWLTKEGKKRLLIWSNSSCKSADCTTGSVICTGIDITDMREREN